jgi:hypothetical protein
MVTGANAIDVWADGIGLDRPTRVDALSVCPHRDQEIVSFADDGATLRASWTFLGASTTRWRRLSPSRTPTGARERRPRAVDHARVSTVAPSSP